MPDFLHQGGCCHALAYISRTEVDADTGMIVDILGRSQRRNAEDGITGLLLYHNRAFFQILEGEWHAVARCYSRIQVDSRHFGAAVIWEDRVHERSFESWSMAHATPDILGADWAPIARRMEEVARAPLPGSHGSFVAGLIDTTLLHLTEQV